MFPVFLKLNELRVLLVGAGNVGLEKLTAMLNNSPAVNLTVVAEEVSLEVLNLAAAYPQVRIVNRSFEPADLDDKDLVVVATGNAALNSEIRALVRERHLLINVADQPALCDFYLGSIV